MAPGIVAASTSKESAGDLRRRRELANFLLSRRQAMSPATCGLPQRSRRRVNGLRREEVAELSGISSSWYTWLEQGRDIHVSSETLMRLAGALGLAEDEREQLFLLANLPPPRLHRHDTLLPPGLQELIDSFDPAPALVLCSRWDVVAWNHGASRVFGDFQKLLPPERNFLWLLFHNRDFRNLFVDAERMIRCVMGHFRASWGERLHDPEWTSLVQTLERSSAEFRALWREYLVAKPPDWRKEMTHPVMGPLTFDPVTLSVPPAHDLRVLFYRPANAATAARLAAAR